MTQKQVIAAGAFIFDREGRIFLGKFTEKFDKKWAIPGGKLDFGETPIEAVKREAKEETNIDIEDIRFFIGGAFVANNVHVVYMDYMALCPENAEIKINSEFSQWGFFTREQLDTLDILPITKEHVLMAMRIRSRDAFVKYLSECNVGLIRNTVSFQEYQPQWVEAYTWISANLKRALSHHSGNYEMYHIGSTSVSNVSAKPIIDIMLVFSDIEKFKKDITELEQLGFAYKGDIVGKLDSAFDTERHFFAFYNNEENIEYVHIHAFLKGHTSVDEFLHGAKV